MSSVVMGTHSFGFVTLSVCVSHDVFNLHHWLLGKDDYRAVEAPRVTQIDGKFHMTYTAFDANDWFPMVAQSDNLITWDDIGPLERAKNKDHAVSRKDQRALYHFAPMTFKHLDWLQQ